MSFTSKEKYRGPLASVEPFVPGTPQQLADQAVIYATTTTEGISAGDRDPNDEAFGFGLSPEQLSKVVANTTLLVTKMKEEFGCHESWLDTLTGDELGMQCAYWMAKVYFPKVLGEVYNIDSDTICNWLSTAPLKEYQVGD